MATAALSLDELAAQQVRAEVTAGPAVVPTPPAYSLFTQRDLVVSLFKKKRSIVCARSSLLAVSLLLFAFRLDWRAPVLRKGDEERSPERDGRFRIQMEATVSGRVISLAQQSSQSTQPGVACTRVHVKKEKGARRRATCCCDDDDDDDDDAVS